MGQDKDFEYLGKIQDYFAEHKTLPTFSHVAQLLGFKSKNAVTSFVARLKLQGFLDYAPDKRLKPGNAPCHSPHTHVRKSHIAWW